MSKRKRKINSGDGEYDFDRIEATAAKVFLCDGYHTTIHLVFSENGVQHYIADITANGSAVDTVAQIAQQHRVVAVVSIAEAWMALCNKNNAPNVPVSQISGRSEVLVVAVESADESRSVIRRIKRNGSGVTLGEREDGLPNLWGGQFRHLFDGYARLGRSVGE